MIFTVKFSQILHVTKHVCLFSLLTHLSLNWKQKRSTWQGYRQYNYHLPCWFALVSSPNQLFLRYLRSRLHKSRSSSAFAVYCWFRPRTCCRRTLAVRSHCRSTGSLSLSPWRWALPSSCSRTRCMDDTRVDSLQNKPRSGYNFPLLVSRLLKRQLLGELHQYIE